MNLSFPWLCSMTGNDDMWAQQKHPTTCEGFANTEQSLLYDQHSLPGT